MMAKNSRIVGFAIACLASFCAAEEQQSLEPSAVVDQCSSACATLSQLKEQQGYVNKFFAKAKSWGAKEFGEDLAKVHFIGFDKLKSRFSEQLSRVGETFPALVKKNINSTTRFRSSTANSDTPPGPTSGPYDDLDDYDFPENVGGDYPDAYTEEGGDVFGNYVVQSWYADDETIQPFIRFKQQSQKVALPVVCTRYWPYFKRVNQEIEHKMEANSGKLTGCNKCE